MTRQPAMARQPPRARQPRPRLAYRALAAASLLPLAAVALVPPAAASLPAASPATRLAAPAPAVETFRSGGLETTVARLPGRLLASAVARDADGRHGLAMLVVEDGGRSRAPAVRPRGEAADDLAPGQPRSLFFFVPGGAALERLATGLPEKLDAVAAVTAVTAVTALTGSGDRGDALILGEPGVLYALDPPWGGGTAGCRKLLAAPGLDLRSLHGRLDGEPRPRLPWLPTARAGALDLLAGEAAAAALHELRTIASFPLPVAAAGKSWGIELTSPPVQLLVAPRPPAPPAPPPPGQATAFSVRFAAGPEAQGALRLKTLLLATGAGESPVEAWSLLPAAAQDLESTYAVWDGRPVLAVTSIPRLGIFVKRDLQLFVLDRDRSRRGTPPVLAVHTDCHLWHRIRTYFADLGATGRQDLVLIHPEGMGGKKLRFQVYASAGPGRLAARPRTSTVDVEAFDWFYGADFNGDGVPDLLVRERKSHRLLLYPGVPRAYRVADRPSWSFNLPVPPPPPPGAAKAAKKAEDDGNEDEEGDEGGDDASSSGPAAAPAASMANLVDLSGDGHATLLLAIADAQGRSQIVAVRQVPR